MTTTSIPRPRSASKAGKANNFELNSWLFMRGSGLLLVVLVLGHLFVNLWQGEGIHQIDFAFVAGKWATPFWQVWDLAMLWLAMLHGMNGLRTIINDYASRAGTKFTLKTLLYFATFVTVALGTLVIFTFDPCIDPSSTLEVCTHR
ncbi:MAG TPA: succinate dehydrogenase hydrophobic membrane anchor subunit [Nocardioidaceae bacterium]